MCNTSLLFCLIVVAGTWAKSEDGSDLNLKSIFRTPKDFTKVNFDHFELLERNNFDEKKAAAQTTKDEKVEEGKKDDKTSKSVANAHVMLRIGGEDIHDCKKVVLHRPSYASHGPDYSKPLPLHSNDVRYPHIPPHVPHPYLCPPPFNYPGNYYGPSPLPNYQTSSYQGIKSDAPYEFAINSPETLTTLDRSGEENFLELPKKDDVICTESARSQGILEKPSPCGTTVEEVELVDLPREPCKAPEQHVHLTNAEPAQPIVVQTSYASEPTVKVSTPKCVTINTIRATTLDPNPSPNKVAYAEVNLADVGKTYFEPSEDDISTLLDQALVPLSCQKCSKTKPFLVSYPVITTGETTAVTRGDTEVVVSGCPGCNDDAFSDSCNRDRNPKIPYGHRFSKDIDSLFDIADGGPKPYVPPCAHVPPNLYNEAPSENLIHKIKIQPALPLKKLEPISTIAHTEAECQPKWLLQETVPAKENVEIVHPCPETVESTRVKQEVIQESSPCSQAVVAIDTPCAAKTESVEVTKVVEPTATNHHIDLPIQNTCEQPSRQEVTETVKPCKTIESPCATQEVIQVSNPAHESFEIQPTFKDIFTTSPAVPNHESDLTKYYPQGETVQTLNSYPESQYVQKIVEVSNSCHESPYTTQEVVQTINPHQETTQSIFQNSPFAGNYAARFTKPSTKAEVTFYPCDGSAPTSNVVELGNSYSESPYRAPKVDHSITIQPVYEKLPSATSEAPTYQTIFANPQREVIESHNQYIESPHVQELVEEGNSYNESPYATRQIIQTSNSYPETVVSESAYSKVPAVHVGHSYKDAPYTTQEIIETSNPYTNTVYNNVPTVHVSNSYNQAPYVTQEIIQISNPYPETVYNNVPTVHVSNLYNNAPCATQEVIQASGSHPETFTIQKVYNKVPTINVRNSYDEVPYTTQEEFIQSRNKCPETFNIKPFYNNAPTLELRNAYDQLPSASEEAIQRSDPQTINIQPAYNKVPTIQVRNSYDEGSYTTQEFIQSRNACPDTITVTSGRSGYNSVPATSYTVLHNNPYHQTASDTAAYTTTEAKIEKPLVYFSSADTSGQSQFSVDNAQSNMYVTSGRSGYNSVPVNSYSAQHVQVSSPYPTAEVNIEKPEVYFSGAEGNGHSQNSPFAGNYAARFIKPSTKAEVTFYPCDGSAPTNEQPNMYVTSGRSGYNSVPVASYTDSSYTVETGVQVGSPYHQTATGAYPTTEVKLEKPLVYLNDANEQSKVYVDGYKETSGRSGYNFLPVASSEYVKGYQATSLGRSGYNSVPASAVYTHSAADSTPTTQFIQQSQSIHPFLSLSGNYKPTRTVAPVNEHPVLTDCVSHQTKISHPHVYKIVDRYNDVTKGDIRTLNIPELVSTNRYLKVDKPGCHIQHLPVDNVPLLKNELYAQTGGHGWPFWKNVRVQRETPLEPNYFPICDACAKYRGELNQVTYDR